MRVWVFPVPGGPWIKAISGDAKANFMACFWEGLRLGVCQVIGSGPRARPRAVSSVGTGVGVARPKRMRMKGLMSEDKALARVVMVWYILRSAVSPRASLVVCELRVLFFLPLVRHIVCQLHTSLGLSVSSSISGFLAI